MSPSPAVPTVLDLDGAAGVRGDDLADVYEHVTPEARQRVLEALQKRWESSIKALGEEEYRQLLAVVPPGMAEDITYCYDNRERWETRASARETMISQISPRTV